MEARLFLGESAVHNTGGQVERVALLQHNRLAGLQDLALNVAQARVLRAQLIREDVVDLAVHRFVIEVREHAVADLPVLLALQLEDEDVGVVGVVPCDKIRRVLN